MGFAMKVPGVISAVVAAFLALPLMSGVWAQTAVAPATSGPATRLVEPPAPLLPTNTEFVPGGSAGGQWAEPQPIEAILKEDGAVRRDSRAMQSSAAKPGGLVGDQAGDLVGDLGGVQAFQFGDVTGAEAAYTALRQGGHALRAELPGVQETAMPGGDTLVLSGVTVLRFMKVREVTAALKVLEPGLPKAMGRRAIAPLLPTLFPANGLDAGSMRYALGPVGYQAMDGRLPAEILGWDKSAEVASANYGGRGGHGTLTLYLYPTPEIAGIVGRQIEQGINQKGPASFGTVKLKRIGPLVAMTSGGWTAAQAQALVDAVSLHQEVTFQKPIPPEFHAEIRKTVSLMQGIAIFTGVLILAALVIGLFLGGGRAAIRVMQGKSAASEPEFLTIDLSGRPEPLKPSHPE